MSILKITNNNELRDAESKLKQITLDLDSAVLEYHKIDNSVDRYTYTKELELLAIKIDNLRSDQAGLESKINDYKYDSNYRRSHRS